MKKPTTAECIAWLEGAILQCKKLRMIVLSTAFEDKKIEILSATRAQLLAAHELAKALERKEKEYHVFDGQEALTAWHEAGGE